LLAEGKWEEADNENRRLLCVVAGSEAVKRKWVYFSEVKSIPVADLQTMDNLWTAYSNGRYGYTVQRKLWMANKRQWGKLFQKIDWVTGENNAYRKWPEGFLWVPDAAKGHLPLTNALRGTQLFEAILLHEAFGGEPEKKKEESSGKDGKAKKKGGGGKLADFASRFKF